MYHLLCTHVQWQEEKGEKSPSPITSPASPPIGDQHLTASGRNWPITEMIILLSMGKWGIESWIYSSQIKPGEPWQHNTVYEANQTNKPNMAVVLSPEPWWAMLAEIWYDGMMPGGVSWKVSCIIWHWPVFLLVFRFCWIYNSVLYQCFNWIQEDTSCNLLHL